jgi:HlyD family secretion protein
MKKILLIVLAVVVAAGLVAFFIYRQQSGYTKVLTAKIARQDLATVVSGTGQIKPKTYVNLGATSMGRITHLYVKEGDMVKKGQTVATIENVQQEANVEASRPPSPPPRPTLPPILPRKRPPRPTSSTPRPIWSRSGWTGSAPRASTRTASWPSRTSTPRRPPTTPMWPRGQAVAALNQAKAQTDSAARPPATRWPPCAPTRTL